MNIFVSLIGIVCSYLLGAIPSAYLAVRITKGVDIRKFGSGNVGATNALRLVGKLPALLVLLFDIGKGFLAVSLLTTILLRYVSVPAEFLKAFFGAAVVSGHVFNVFLQFKGGKGVATSTGVLLGVAPLSVLVGAASFFIVVAITKYVSLGSIIGAVIMPFFLLYTKTHYSFVILSAFLCILIVYKHKTNIKRLLNGKERRIFEK